MRWYTTIKSHLPLRAKLQQHFPAYGDAFTLFCSFSCMLSDISIASTGQILCQHSWYLYGYLLHNTLSLKCRRINFKYKQVMLSSPAYTGHTLVLVITVMSTGSICREFTCFFWSFCCYISFSFVLTFVYFCGSVWLSIVPYTDWQWAIITGTGAIMPMYSKGRHSHDCLGATVVILKDMGKNQTTSKQTILQILKQTFLAFKIDIWGKFD